MGQWTNLPNGISLSTATGAVDGVLANATSITCSGDITATGAITGAAGSVYGARVPMPAIAATGSVGGAWAVTSAAADTPTTYVAPCSGYPEVILIQGATAAITQTITVYADSVTTGAAIATLSVTSVVCAAGTVYTAIGGTVCTQGSFIIIKHAATATTNSASIMLNIVEAV